MNYITDILYWITTGLLVPTVVFLLFFLVKALFMIGSFYGLYISRNKVNVKIRRQMESEGVDRFLEHGPQVEGKGNELSEFMGRIPRCRHSAAALDKLVGDYEIAAEKELGKSKLLVKIGPMLGLMGTLIPMGPALVGLSTGDIASMASNMQVAFATTVVGLLIGGVGFITLQVKQHWFADDVNMLVYVTDTLKEENTEKSK